MTIKEAPQGAQAVLRAISLLKAFSVERAELSLQELCSELGLTRTTTHRLLSALESEGLLSRNPATSSYRLGPAIIALGSQALLTSDLRASVKPTLERLATQTGETATLEVMVGDQMLVLDGVSGKHLVSANLDIGTRWPAYLTSTGKAMLASMSTREREHILNKPLTAYTEKSRVNVHDLEQDFQECIKQGYAVAVEELEADYVAVASVFRGQMGNTEGAISIGGPARRLDEARIREVGDILRQAAEDLSQRHLS